MAGYIEWNPRTHRLNGGCWPQNKTAASLTAIVRPLTRHNRRSQAIPPGGGQDRGTMRFGGRRLGAAAPHNSGAAQQAGSGQVPFVVLLGTGSYTQFSGHCSPPPSPSGTGEAAAGCSARQASQRT